MKIGFGFLEKVVGWIRRVERKEKLARAIGRKCRAAFYYNAPVLYRKIQPGGITNIVKHSRVFSDYVSGKGSPGPVGHNGSSTCSHSFISI